MAPVSAFSALTFEHLHLRRQLVESQARELQRSHQQIQREITAHLEAMRAEVGADPKAQYNPQTKTFILAAGPTPLKAPASRQVKRAEARKAAG